MITITEQAVRQIQIAAEKGNMAGMPLRIAVRQNADGSIDYGMGFDENKGEQDIQLRLSGVDVLIADSHADLLSDAVLDFVELNAGEFQFIFINPNDPAATPPSEYAKPGPRSERD